MREIKTKVLITTSGLGTRLGELSKYSNKSLIKLGDKAIISHIIDYYDCVDDFVITLGYFGDLVKQYLELAHPEKRFEFVWVDPYEGPGSGLLTSMSFAKDKLQCPFIFHACDTIIADQERTPLHKNYMACVDSDRSDLYRTVCVDFLNIRKINDKGELNYDYAYIGVAGIYDYELFWKKLEKIQEHKIKDSSDCHVLSSMLSETEIQLWHVDKWFDTGSVNSLNEARKRYNQNFNVLDKPEENIYFIDNSVIKFFSDAKICKNRVERTKVLNGLIPEVQGYSDNFYKYKLAEGELLADVITEDKLIELVNFGEYYLWNPAEVEKYEFLHKCLDFYLDKTINRITQIQLLNAIIDQEEYINGTLTPSLDFMLSNIDWNELTKSTPTGFHGDFILDNILYDKNSDRKFTLLDWRQDFAGLISAGDKYYDLAKLNHNLVLNHHILLNKHFTISIDKNNITCDVLRSQNMVNCQVTYLDLLDKRGIDVSKLKILTAIIWLNMSPLHTYPLNNFLYYFGKYNLWRELKKKI